MMKSLITPGNYGQLTDLLISQSYLSNKCVISYVALLFIYQYEIVSL